MVRTALVFRVVRVVVRVVVRLLSLDCQSPGRYAFAMPYTLLFNGGCASCSKAAREIVEMSLPGLEVRALTDPAVLERIGQAGLEPPDRPALLIDDGDRLRIATGWAMRAALARLAGWNRADRIVRLVSIEHRARAASRPGTITRRSALGRGLAALAAVVGSTLLPRSVTNAAAADGVFGAANADVQRALGAQSVRDAIATWGPVLSTVKVVNQGTESVLAFGFTNHPDLALLVDNTAAATPANTAALGMTVITTGSGRIRLFDTSGQALVDVSVRSGNVVVTDVSTSRVPEFIQDIERFLGCLGAHVSAGCVLNCIGCVTGGFFTQLIDCPQCILCAGPAAIHCARLYFP